MSELGDIIAGNYRLEAFLGRGGYGTVYRAFDLRLARPVAIKLLNAHKLDDASGARFRREADLARQLGHPNTVRLLDSGTDTTGAPFIVYELLTGLPLGKAYEQAGPLPEDRVAKIATQVLRSLMEAHALGIVHRDIKPANLFVCDFAGERDFVKVLDFGIAKAADLPQLTATDVVVGSPRYMAPEQVRGGAVGPATDLYALGLVMAELLEGDRILKGSTLELLDAQASDVPLPLPPRVMASRLRGVVRRATQKNIAERYPDAASMLEDLARLAQKGLAAVPATASLPPPPPPPAHVTRPSMPLVAAPSVRASSLHFQSLPPPTATYPRRPQRTLPVVLGIVLGFVLGGGLIVAASAAACGSCLLLDPGPDPHTSPAVEVSGVRLPTLDGTPALQKLKERLHEQGYSTITQSQEGNRAKLNAYKPGGVSTATVLVETWARAEGAKSSADELRRGGYQVSVDAGRVLAVRITGEKGPDPKAAERLLEVLAKP